MNLDMRKEDGWRHKTLSLTLQTLTVTLGPVKAFDTKRKKANFCMHQVGVCLLANSMKLLLSSSLIVNISHICLCVRISVTKKSSRSSTMLCF